MLLGLYMLVPPLLGANGGDIHVDGKHQSGGLCGHSPGGSIFVLLWRALLLHHLIWPSPWISMKEQWDLQVNHGWSMVFFGETKKVKNSWRMMVNSLLSLSTTARNGELTYNYILGSDGYLNLYNYLAVTRKQYRVSRIFPSWTRSQQA